MIPSSTFLTLEWNVKVQLVPFLKYLVYLGWGLNPDKKWTAPVSLAIKSHMQKAKAKISGNIRAQLFKTNDVVS